MGRKNNITDLSLEEWQISVKDKSKYELVREGEKLSLKKYKIISKDKIDCTKKGTLFPKFLMRKTGLEPVRKQYAQDP